MRLRIGLIIFAVGVTILALPGPARAVCPPDCVPGSGPAATSCFVMFSGIAPSLTATCVDGSSCDLDGKADGVCTLGVQACINVAGLSGCVPSGLTRTPRVTPTKDPVAQGLTMALGRINPAAEGCTPPGLAVPLKVSLAGIRAAVHRLRVSVTSGGKRRIDKLGLTCAPNGVGPSLARDVQPIFTAKCAIPSCHSGSSPSAGQSLEQGKSYGSDVNVHSADVPKMLRVKPGSLKGSFLARKILDQGIPKRGGGALMPLGCPGLPPAGGCLTQAEIFTILSWIADGAPNN